MFWSSANAVDFGLIGFDCSDLASNQTVVSLVNEENCAVRQRKLSSELVKVQLLQTQSYESITYKQCMIVYEVVINRCGTFWEGRNTFRKSYNHVYMASKEMCFDIHNTKVFKDPTRNNLFVHLNGNEGYYNNIVAGSVSDSECKGETFTDHLGETFSDVFVRYEIKILLNKGKANLNLENKNIVLENGVSCKYNDLSCFDVNYGITHWDVGLPSDYCNEKPLFVLYKGIVNKTEEILKDNSSIISYWKNDDENILFYIEKTNVVRICGYEAGSTQHPSIFITEVMDEHHNFRKDSRFSIKNIDMNIFWGMKMSLMYKSIGDHLNAVYDLIQYEKCITDSKIISTTLSLAKIDPNTFGLTVFGSPGYFSKIMGEVAYIIHCKPYSVTVRNDDKCWNEIPINYQGQPKFLAPRSRLIIDYGEEISCSDFFPPLYKFGSDWFSRSNGKMQITKSPVEIKIKKNKDWDFIQLPGMAYKGLYSKTDIEAYKQSINEPLQQKANEINLFRALEGNSKLFSKYSIMNAMKEEEWDGIKKSFLEVSWDWTKDKLFLFGNFSSMVFGGFLVFKTVKFIVNMIFNFYLLNLTLGFSWRNCFAWWDSLTHFFFKSRRNQIKKRN